MNIKDLIQDGKLSDARSQLVEAVKSSPGDQSSRTLLFQVLAYLGEWDKARRHLEIIAAQDATRQAGVQVYLNLIQAEIERIQVTQNQRQPDFLPESPAYIEQYKTACQELDNQQFQAAETIFQEIHTQRPPVSKILTDFGIRTPDYPVFWKCLFMNDMSGCPLNSSGSCVFPGPKRFWIFCGLRHKLLPGKG